MNPRAVIPVLLAALLSMAVAWFHCLYTGDKLARLVGYRVSVMVLPALIFTTLLAAELICFRWMRHALLKESWLWILVGVGIAYLPVILFVAGMTHPE